MNSEFEEWFKELDNNLGPGVEFSKYNLEEAWERGYRQAQRDMQDSACEKST